MQAIQEVIGSIAIIRYQFIGCGYMIGVGKVNACCVFNVVGVSNFWQSHVYAESEMAKLKVVSSDSEYDLWNGWQS